MHANVPVPANQIAELRGAISSYLPVTVKGAVDFPQIFTPQDLEALAKAFDGAVTIASDERGPFARVPVHELRRRLAQAVVEAACHGVRDVNLLRAHALRAVAAGIPHDLSEGHGTCPYPG